MTDLTDCQFDHLKMYFKEDYIIKGKSDFADIVLRQPLFKDIKNNESLFYQTLYVFIGNTTMRRLQLWDMTPRIDWNEISDYELFCILIKSIRSDVANLFIKKTKPNNFQDVVVVQTIKEKYSKLYNSKFIQSLLKIKVFKRPIQAFFLEEHDKKNIFNDVIDFSSFDLYEKAEPLEDGEINKSYVLYSKKENIEISESVYLEIREYFRMMFGIYPKVEYATNKATKEAIIEEERDNIKFSQLTENDKYKSTLLPLVSFCLNHPGFKYRLEDLLDMGIYQFMDSVQRLQIYESTRALNSGLYSGMCDLSKVDKNLFNFMRDTDYKEK